MSKTPCKSLVVVSPELACSFRCTPLTRRSEALHRWTEPRERPAYNGLRPECPSARAIITPSLAGLPPAAGPVADHCGRPRPGSSDSARMREGKEEQPGKLVVGEDAGPDVLAERPPEGVVARHDQEVGRLMGTGDDHLAGV